MTTSLHRFLKASRRAGRLAGWVALAAMLGVAFVSTAGVPDWVIRKIADGMRSSGFVMDVRSMKLRPFSGEIRLRDVTVYRRGVPGPAALKAGRVEVSADLAALVRRQVVVRRIRVSDAVIRPSSMYGPHAVAPSREGKGELGGPLMVELDRCTIQGVEVESLSFDIRMDATSTLIDNIGGSLKNRDWRGDVSGRLVFDRKNAVLSGHVVTLMDPRLVIPILREWQLTFLEELFGRFDFRKAPPRCEFDFIRPFTRDGFLLKGKIGLEDAAYQDVDVRRADGRLVVDYLAPEPSVALESLRVERPEGAASAAFTIYPARHWVRFDGESEINPQALMQMIGVLGPELKEFGRFQGPVKAMGSGVADYGGMTNTDFSVVVEGAGVGIGVFLTEQCSFSMRMVGCTNTLSDVRGRIYGGEFSGTAVFVAPTPPASNVAYRIEAKISQADVKELSALAPREKEKKEGYRGRLAGTVTVQGLMGTGNGKTATGEGHVTISNGRVFTMPLFGGLTELMTKYIPGLNFVLTQTDANADFAIGDGRVYSDKVTVAGDVISMSGRGQYYFDGGLDFKVQVKLLKEKTIVGKIVQWITLPISELFEFRLGGTLEKPRWSTQHLSKNAEKKAGVIDREARPAEAPKVEDVP